MLPAGVALRPVTAADQDFLLALFASTRTAELAHLPGGEPQQQAFLNLQFAAQSAAYRSAFPTAAHELIAVDGEPAGRWLVDRAGASIHLVDLSLLPGCRGRGVGTALLQSLLAEGRETARPVTLTVEASNPAARLYDRLGFRTVGREGFHLRKVAGERP